MTHVAFTRTLFVSAIIGAAGSANAAFGLTNRMSLMSVGYLYGLSPNLNSGNDAWQSESLTSDFSWQIAGSVSDDGIGPNGPWTTNVTYDLDQWINPTSTSISGFASTFLSSTATGGAISNIQTGLPGNSALLMFDNNSTTDYILNGTLTPDAFITLKRHNGSEWVDVFSTSSAGPFSNSGTITAGNYYIHAVSSAAAMGTMTADSSWSFQFAAVPEPATFGVLGLGIAALLRRRRK